jgi:hypothetical protein
VTPSDKPSRNGKNAGPEAERTTVLATSEEDGQAEPTGAEQTVAEPSVPNGTGGGNGSGELTDEFELNHVVPPPWQRVNNDAAYAMQAEETANFEEDDPLDAPTTAYHPGGAEVPLPLEHPVVTGTAASRVYADPMAAPTVAQPPLGGPGVQPPRTTVHLDGATVPPVGMRQPAAQPPNVLRRPGRGPRRANLQIKRFDPWSVLKLSLVLGVALFFVWLVAVGALYAVLDGMGVWDKVNGISNDLLQGNGGNSQPLISAGRVFGVAAIVGAINIVLFSALATVGAFVYNVSADLAGGLEVTLAERE